MVEVSVGEKGLFDVEILDKGVASVGVTEKNEAVASVMERAGVCLNIVGKYNSRSYEITNITGDGSDIYVIGEGDNAFPTDKNVYSALRTKSDFLSRKSDDTAEGNITFRKNVSVGGLLEAGSLSVNNDSHIKGNQTVKGEQVVVGKQTLHNGFETSNFNNAGGQIVGAQLTNNGIMTVAGLKAMSFEVFELVYNIIRAQGGKFAFSNSATIESCYYKMSDGSELSPDDYNGQGIEGIDFVYLTIKKDGVNRAIPFIEGDIIYGYVNKIDESGQYARGGQCVMYIVNAEGEELDEMVLKAKLFPIGDPSGNDGVVISNIPPANGMDVAQRGNIYADIDTGKNLDRLTSFFVDTETSNFYMLSNVTSPTLNKANYALVNGQLPADLYNEIKDYYTFIKPYDPVAYARYGIFENILQIDHLRQPIKRENNRGEWSASTTYYSTVSYYDTVTFEGQLYKCVAEQTNDNPAGSNDWLLLVAKGDTGPQGERGAMLSHQGTYDPKKLYVLNYSEDGTVFSYPCVYLKAEQGLGSYLTLRKDMDRANSEGYPIDENGDVIESNNTEYWKITPYTEQTFTKFLMANYAQFGSDRGAVFYDRFLFSQYGVNKQGEFVRYDDYQGIMFDDNGFSGDFIPALAIDMYQGYAKTNKLAETFQEYRYFEDGEYGNTNKKLYANEIRFNETYNVKYEHKYNPCVLAMPQSQDIEYNGEIIQAAQQETGIDGVRSIIVNKANRAWSAKHRATLHGTTITSPMFNGFSEAANYALLLCSSPLLLNPYAWRYYKSAGVEMLENVVEDGSNYSYEKGTIVINGVFTRFVLVEPGMQVIMRSCKSDDVLYWYIENSDDFVEVPYTVWVEMNRYYNGSTLASTPEHIKWQQLGYDWSGGTQNANRCYVSKGLHELLDKFDQTTFNIDIYSGDFPENSIDDWHWEKCITGVSINYEHI